MKTWKSKRGVYLIAEIGGNHEGNFDNAYGLFSSSTLKYFFVFVDSLKSEN